MLKLAVSASTVLFVLFTVVAGEDVAGAKGRANDGFAASEEITVHVVFGNHLDVGYTDLDLNVINRYFTEHFPRAIRLATEMRHQPIPGKFVYTTHCWLVSLYVACPDGMGLSCPNAETLSEFEAAIKLGELTWHAFPFNGQAEFYDNELYSYALSLCHELDARYGLTPKITLSQRDVPGLTRGALPLLAAAGIKALSVGVNAATGPPAVPHFTPFLWRDEASGASIITMYHPGGYGGWWKLLNVDRRYDCIRTPGASHVLCVAWRNDNEGPPTSLYEVGLMVGQLRVDWPEATVIISCFDDFTRGLMADIEQRQLTLPEFKGEIGDTWVHGSGSDPVKLAEHRSLSRARRDCLRRGLCREQDPELRMMSRMLVKNGEHTWGINIQSLNDWASWSNEQLQAGLTGGPGGKPLPNFQLMIDSWLSQTHYNQRALEALPPGHPIRVAVEADRASRAVVRGQMSAMSHRGIRLEVGRAGLVHRFRTRYWHLEVDAVTGSITHLSRLHPLHTTTTDTTTTTDAWDSDITTAQGDDNILQRSGINWVGPGGLFAVPMYSSYSEETFNEELRHYSYIQPPWYSDFGKPNCSSGGAVRRDLPGRLTHMSKHESAGGLSVMMMFTYESWAVEAAGAPREHWVTLRLPHNTSSLEIDSVWQAKTATRLPEALWMRFQPSPLALAPDTWRLHKLASAINPMEVVLNGSHSLHGVSEEGGVTVKSRNCPPQLTTHQGPARRRKVLAEEGGAGGSKILLPSATSNTEVPPCEVLRVRSLDVALVSPGAPYPLPSPDVPPDMSQGVSFNLYNNAWGTGFIMWYPYDQAGEDLKFRFIVDVEEEAATMRQMPSGSHFKWRQA